jgi:hypothetical protein
MGIAMIVKDGPRADAILESIVTFVLCVVIYVISSHYDFLESIVSFSHLHEDLEVDELVTVCIFLAFALSVTSCRRYFKLRDSERILRATNEKLGEALSEVRQLKEMLPICSECKKIRDDVGDWHRLETYIKEHTGTDFTHGICPDCVEKLYPELGD